MMSNNDNGELKSLLLTDESQAKKVRNMIIAASVAIPLVVVLLFMVKLEGITFFSFLPSVYAVINAMTALVLIAAYIAVKKNNNRLLHRKLIRFALLLSLLFLLLYVLYHMTNEATYYGDVDRSGSLDILERNKVGSTINFYYFILASHVLLSILVVPLVLFTYLFAWQGNFERHKKWNRFAFPIWLYVAISGVIVYLLISPYY